MEQNKASFMLPVNLILLLTSILLFFVIFNGDIIECNMCYEGDRNL